jgi:hypothetical protein
MEGWIERGGFRCGGLDAADYVIKAMGNSEVVEGELNGELRRL